MEKGDATVARVLLENGADANLADNAGWLPLHLSSYDGHLGCVQVLTEAGVNVDEVVTTKGLTSLQLAAERGHAEVVKHLIEVLS